LTLENGLKIELYFAPYHFPHLLGLQYLKDIPQVVQTPLNSATAIYRNIKKSYITYSDLKKSAFFSKIESRVEYFSHIGELFNQRIIIDFDPTKVKKTEFKAKYILFKSHELGYLHLCLANDLKVFYPESYIYESSKYYTTGQTFLDIVDVEIKPFTGKKATVN
jgi:hypothetical protein